MRVSLSTSSLLVAVMGALIIAPITQPIANAGATAGATQTNLQIQTGTVSIFASAVQTFTNSQNELSVSVANGVAKTFWVNNSGNLDASQFSMTINLPNKSNVATFKRCAVNASFTGTNACSSGSPINVAITPGSSSTYTLPLSAGSFYSFQIVQNKAGLMTVSTAVNTANLTTGNFNS